MERKVTLKEWKEKSLRGYLDLQTIKLDRLKDFVTEGNQVDEKLLTTMKELQNKDLEVYERYLKTQKAFATKLKCFKDNDEKSEKSGNVKSVSSVVPNEIIDNLDLSDPRSIKRFEVKALSRDEVSRGASKLPSTGTIILIGKENEYVKTLITYLNNRGLKVSLIDSIIKDEDVVKEKVDEIAKTSQISGMIAVGNAFLDELDEDKSYDYFLTIVYLTKYVSLYMRENKELVNPVMLFNTFLDGKLGVTGEYDNHLYSSFTGFAKSVAIELLGQVGVKEIDFEPSMTAQEMIKALDDEMCCTDLEAEIGRTKDGSRYVLKAYMEKSVVTENKCNITEEDVILVTGGSRGVTSNCLYELAKRVKCKIVILGRAKITDENADDEETSKITELKDMKTLIARRYKEKRFKGSFKEIESKAKAILAQRDMLQTFELIRTTGNEVHYYSCDVRDKDNMASTIKEIEQNVGQITGVIHGAGIIYDQKIYNKMMDFFKLVYETKYHGINYIMNSLDKSKLKFLVMFSSVSGYFGNDGQSDYSAGNEYLDKYAYYLNKKYPNCKTLAINWGAWDGGMMDPIYRKTLTEKGFVLIPLEVGANYFANEFLMGLPSRQILITNDGTMGH